MIIALAPNRPAEDTLAQAKTAIAAVLRQHEKPAALVELEAKRTDVATRLDEARLRAHAAFQQASRTGHAAPAAIGIEVGALEAKLGALRQEMHPLQVAWRETLHAALRAAMAQPAADAISVLEAAQQQLAAPLAALHAIGGAIERHVGIYQPALDDGLALMIRDFRRLAARL